jgi:DNA polymerase III subunit delta'
VTTLQNIFGQERAIEMLTNAWRSGRLPHAMIFAGPQGVGKATTARALAALFLCASPKGDKPCGKCGSCVVMAAVDSYGATNHPDFHVVYRQLVRLEKEDSKARDLPIDVIRQYLVEPAGRTPMMNGGKVFVIEEAELMNTSAQNAMLKTLEEPSGRTLVILLTDQPHCLLPTIRSRTQTIPFASLDPGLVVRELEKRRIDKATALEAAALSEGSLGLALRWIEDGVIAAARQLIEQTDALVAGRSAGSLAAFFDAASKDYGEKQLKRDEKASKEQMTREGLALYLKLAANRLRQKLAETTNGEQLEQICAAIDAIVRAETYLDSNVNVPLTLQQLTVALHRELVS